VSNESLPIWIEIHFVTIGPSGDDGPKVKMKCAGEPAFVVETLVSRAIAAGGVWDRPIRIFHPWHTVLRVNWYQVEPTKEEVEQGVSEAELLDARKFTETYERTV
jgi:hypothetical protein